VLSDRTGHLPKRLAASRRNTEALAGMHETMLAKIKTATVDVVDLRDGEPDERRH